MSSTSQPSGEPGIPPRGTGRREFLLCGVQLGALAAASALVGGLPGCALFVRKAEPDGTVSARDGVVTVPADLLPGAGARGPAVLLAIAGTDDKLLLLRAANGEIVALDPVCTHRGCDVEYDTAVGHIVCPCHGSEYDIHGGLLEGPAKRPLTAYAVHTVNGEVRIDFGR